MKTLIVLLLAALTAGAPTWQLDFEQAKTEARQGHKLILLNFSGSDWCGPCIQLKKNVFESAEFGQFAAERLVLVRADFPRLSKNKLSKEQEARNEALAERYNQEGKFPFTVLLDANGRVLREWDGYAPSLTPAAFVQTIEALAPASR
jgi:thioredoxin-related protein